MWIICIQSLDSGESSHYHTSLWSARWKSLGSTADACSSVFGAMVIAAGTFDRHGLISNVYDLTVFSFLHEEMLLEAHNLSV